ncbi:Subtilisin-like protease [Heracleum sosnowskyi]|uniref:Subtilisin-like protease n=1 Tax=Heracleum sosnowskyi TaxID=360622 RepID=A0AAD8JE26_9APIA|nr:Subtilisin-like protease [Heracleum sosnowskyi]
MASVWSHGLITLVIAHFLLQEHSFVLVNASSNVHIVYMGDKRCDEPELVRDSHHAIVSTILGSKEAAQDSILYSYRHGFSGFAVVLTPSQAEQISGFPGVIRVIPNKILNLQTTRSWDFLHVKPQIANGILSEGQSGRGSIIGVLDTGIWPESKSFVDDGMAEVPSRWRGICQEGEKFSRSNCNRKIIGARWYIKGYEAEFGKLNKSDGVEFLSPRDASGHGTHTSSTAAGAIVENASYMGLAEGFARGGAPSAWLAVYKVCWSTGGCSSADLLAAFDDAIFDGVDLLSVSIGSPPPLSSYVDDLLAMGSFHAVARGIPVICSSGNSGPYSQTVTNTAPWMITVAASTMDRAFPTVITMGNNQTIVGQAIYTGEIDDKFYPIVYGEDILSKDADESDARTCLEGSLNETLVVGKVVLCFQSRSLRSATTVARTIQKLQGVGLIFSQFPAKDVIVSSLIPCVQVDFELGTHLLAYMATTRNPVVKLSKTKTVVGQQISPEVAFFSSRGPSSLSPTVLKPDIAAPGVNILASWSAASPAILVKNSQNQDHRQDFRIESGTSMSCPHISGIVSLIKAIHPTWSPAAIRSALVTTASIYDEFGQSAIAEGAPHKQADPFDYGGGHVDANKAIDPGLIYDINVGDYLQFLCSMGYNNTAISWMFNSAPPCRKTKNFLVNFNLPSISIPELKKTITISRTVSNVGPIISVYFARIEAPPGTNVRVEPPVLSFNSDTKKLKFKVTIRPLLKVQGRYSFGYLFWEDGFHVVRIPLVVRSVIQDSYAQT